MLFTIDNGGTFIKYGLMDADYQLVHTDKISTPSTIEEFWQVIKKSLLLYGRNRGIAISCPRDPKSLGFCLSRWSHSIFARHSSSK